MIALHDPRSPPVALRIIVPMDRRAHGSSPDGPDGVHGQDLRALVPTVVDDIVAEVHPARVILFGSVVRGEDTSGSDLDVLVVLDHLEPHDRARLMGSIRFAIRAHAPIDVFVTDTEEFESRKDVNGSMLYWPAREGQVVYERAAA